MPLIFFSYLKLANTLEYTINKKATGKLLRAVQNIVLQGADLLSEVNRAADLVSFLTNQIEQNPKYFHVFVKVLMEDGATYKEALKFLEPIYRDPDAEDLPCSPSASDVPRKPSGTFPVNIFYT